MYIVDIGYILIIHQLRNKCAFMVFKQSFTGIIPKLAEIALYEFLLKSFR